MSAYPNARRLDVADELHGRRVADPYRWLEDASCDESRTWSEAQDALVETFLRSLPGRDRLRARLFDLQPGLVSTPGARGGRLFFLRREPSQEHACLIVREPDGTERVLIDPASLSEDASTTLDAISPSKEGNLLAHQLSEGGDEESVLRVMDVATGKDVDGPIDRCRYSAVAWLPGERSFYYVRKLPKDQVPAGEEQFHRRVYLHHLGSTSDELVFGEGLAKGTYIGVSTSPDGRWLMIGTSVGTAPRNDLFITDLRTGAGPVAIQQGEDVQTDARVHVDGRLYLFTNRNAPRWKLAVADPASPLPGAWRDLLPETDAVLEGYALTDDAVVALRTRHAVSEVTVHDLATGAVRAQVPLPGLGSAGIAARPEGGDDLWVAYTDHVTPTTVLHYSVGTGAMQVWAEPPGAVDVKGISARQVFVTSKDGTQVPMFVIARDDVAADGSRPTILNGYGGFNVPMTPAYQSTILGWVERGGVYAVACMRGGSEYGEEWHRAGMRERKQNVFDDFVAAGEWLIANGYTSSEHLGIQGGSNGGLLVGAALTQRPDLFRAVVCSAPLLDMIRYERFGLGETWNDEYGTVADATELGWLLGYSPYHNVKEGTAYPSVLFTVFDSDTRVDPMHARKMCAALQHATRSERPILIRREGKVGHGARSLTRTIDLGVDTASFMADALGLDLDG